MPARPKALRFMPNQIRIELGIICLFPAIMGAARPPRRNEFFAARSLRHSRHARLSRQYRCRRAALLLKIDFSVLFWQCELLRKMYGQK